MATIDKLAGIMLAVAPRTSYIVQSDTLRPWMLSAGISTPHRIAAFIGQMACESWNFTTLEEDLNYSAERLLEVWPSHFRGLIEARQFGHQPSKIADRVYANRMGNGDEASGDGWRFRGSGLIQLSGRTNQQEFAEAVELVDGVDIGEYLRLPRGAAQSACWFWSANGLNHFADSWALTPLTEKINGGNQGLKRRLEFCNKALAAATQI